MTFIAVRCPHCHSEQIVKRGKTRRGTHNATCARTPRAPRGVFSSITATADAS